MNARKSQSTQHESTTIQEPNSESLESSPDWWADRQSIFLLIALYTAQGLPMGLAFGSIPFLLKEQGATYIDLAQFSFASLPYSLKLFIAPIIDSIYNRSFGLRKSWIVPVQIIISFVCLFFSTSIQYWIDTKNISSLMLLMFLLITMAAIQDIAVDGWSLTLLNKRNVSYASTCQSLGLSIGYFTTFTIFLALSNRTFCTQYIYPYLPFIHTKNAITDLNQTFQLISFFYLIVTCYITFFKSEYSIQDDPKKTDIEIPFNHSTQQSTSSKLITAYKQLFTILLRPSIQKLIFVLLIGKVGFSPYDHVLPLKLLELGFSKERMASIAVIQTPFTLLGTILTGRWSAKQSPITVYLFGFVSRFILSLTGPICIYYLSIQNGVVTPFFYFIILSLSILYSITTDCLMFVGMGAFFLNITASSVQVAASYLTLLNTSSNMGGIWHKALTLWMVDKFTFRTNCEIPTDATNTFQCPIKYDGYYILSLISLPIAITVAIYFFKTLPRLQKLPDSAWRVSVISSRQH